MHLPPPPEARELLPPLLACLPTAFLAPQPPPALMPLLSPIMRQRVNYMSSSTERTEHGWLPLLQWNAELAAKLPPVVDRILLEPHPVSGELELDDVRPAKYRRLDDETLHSRLEVEQFDLLPVFVWCENDEHGQTGAGWKVAELRTIEDVEDGTEWFETMSEANEAANTHSFAVPQAQGDGDSHRAFAIPADDEEEDDGSYWAAYDKTPGDRTPAQKRSPAPPSNTAGNRARTQSELEYFNRYGDVQPALDGHDPDEEMPDMGESSLTGNALSVEQARQQQPQYLQPHLDTSKAQQPHDSAIATALTQSLSGADSLSMPRPMSPTSSHSSVDRLEEKAEEMSTTSRSQGDERAQLGIKQHISTDIKSLFRLARSVGIERREFEEVVRRELDVLSMFEQDD